MANSVHLSGLLRVDEIRRIPGLGTVMEATIFEEPRKSKARQQSFPVYLTGQQQIELVIKNNHVDSKELPFVVVNGRLFRVNGALGCVVLGQYIQFTGAYGVPDEAD